VARQHARKGRLRGLQDSNGRPAKGPDRLAARLEDAAVRTVLHLVAWSPGLLGPARRDFPGPGAFQARLELRTEDAAGKARVFTEKLRLPYHLMARSWNYCAMCTGRLVSDRQNLVHAKLPKPWPSSSLLACLSADVREVFLGLGVIRHYRSGQVLMREGDWTTHAILLHTGLVKVTAIADTGRNALLAIRMGGDLIGELGAIGANARTATVTAATNVIGNVIARSELLGFLRRYPEVSFAITAMVGQRLRMANRRRLDIAGFNSNTRIARILLDLGERLGNDISRTEEFEIAITQRELAELAGLTQVSVQRALRTFRAKGLLTTSYGRIVVRRTDLLRVEGQIPSGSISII
jgi:CRP/FNR family transcriptional regulator, cyclic AMP receptor protein